MLAASLYYSKEKNAFLFDEITKKRKSKLWYMNIHLHLTIKKINKNKTAANTEIIKDERPLYAISRNQPNANGFNRFVISI